MMQGFLGPDLYLVIGVILLGLSVPALFSAMSDNAPPRGALFMLVVAGICFVAALKMNPGGYALEDVPMAFTRVFGKFLH